LPSNIEGEKPAEVMSILEDAASVTKVLKQPNASLFVCPKKTTPSAQMHESLSQMQSDIASLNAVHKKRLPMTPDILKDVTANTKQLNSSMVRCFAFYTSLPIIIVC
jgi:hypothetical protein